MMRRRGPAAAAFPDFCHISTLQRNANAGVGQHLIGVTRGSKQGDGQLSFSAASPTRCNLGPPISQMLVFFAQKGV
jgi:hypothetical protein